MERTHVRAKKGRNNEEKEIFDIIARDRGCGDFDLGVFAFSNK